MVCIMPEGHSISGEKKVFVVKSYFPQYEKKIMTTVKSYRIRPKCMKNLFTNRNIFSVFSRWFNCNLFIKG